MNESMPISMNYFMKDDTLIQLRLIEYYDMNYEELVSKIFKIDPKVRFAAVFDNSAKHLAGGMREGLK